MKVLVFAFGPLISYFVLLFYVATTVSFFGKDITFPNGNVLYEYLLIVECYYLLCLLGPTFHKMRNRVVSNL
jgi:hypothetical protein